MNKFVVASLALFIGLLIKVDSVSGMAVGRLVNLDRELIDLAEERERRALNPQELYNFEFLRDEIPAEAARLEEEFPGVFSPELRAFLADLDVRYPRVPAPLPEGVVARVHMVPDAAERARMVDADRRRAQLQRAQAAWNWIKEHPVTTSLIVVGGVAVIIVTVDVIVNGKKSCIGRLFYKNNENKKKMNNRTMS
jgi:hypothetical protein